MMPYELILAYTRYTTLQKLSFGMKNHSFHRKQLAFYTKLLERLLGGAITPLFSPKT